MSKEVHTIDFRLQSNLIVIDVVLDGETKPFLVDTGASNTVIDKRAVDQSAVEGVGQAVGSEACGAGGSLEAAMTTVKSLALGDVTLSDLRVAGIDLDGINQKIGAEIAGILGFDVLSRFKVTIDYRAKKLTLVRHSPN
jgi:predicted aspartyl protease